jgi:hypothetical protein
MGKKSIRAIAFILRCSGAATVGYELASWLGLHETLWASMSAVIVSHTIALAAMLLFAHGQTTEPTIVAAERYRADRRWARTS